jgi:hypothetical protein
VNVGFTGLPSASSCCSVKMRSPIYSEYIGGDGTIRRLRDRSPNSIRVKVKRVSFQQTRTGWKLRQTASLEAAS